MPSRDGKSVFVGARDCGYIGHFDIATRAFTTIVPTGASLPCTDDANGDGRAVYSMVEGPDSRLYFTLYDAGTADDGASAIGRVDPDGTDLMTTAVGEHPLDIANGPDGQVWFTVNGPPGQVGRVDPATFDLDVANVPGDVQGPRGIVPASDGKLYVLGGEADVIWRATPGDPPVLAEVADAGDGLNGPSFGEVGPDDRIWFGQLEDDSIAGFAPASGDVDTIPMPGSPFDVTFGGDGFPYITTFSAGLLQYRRAENQRRIIAGPGGVDGLSFLAPGATGEVYAAHPDGDRMFDVVTDQAPLVRTGEAFDVAADRARVAAFVDARRIPSQTWVEFGTTESYERGITVPIQDVPATNGERRFEAVLENLAPSTTYHYRAKASNNSGAEVTGADATFTTAPAPPFPPPPVLGPLPAQRVHATVRARWRAGRRRTRVRSLSVTELPLGAQLQVRCSRRGCPFRSRRIPLRAGAINASLTRRFARRRLRPGTVIEIRITLPGAIGQVVRFTVRRRRAPRRTELCLPVGSARPQASC